MAPTLTLQQVQIAVVARNHNPSILNPDFLFRNSVVPETARWKVDGDPISTPPFAQIRFCNGFVISAQFDRLFFVADRPNQFEGEEDIGHIASKYINILPHVSYQAVGVNSVVDLSVASGQLARRHILDHYLANGPWRSYGDETPHATVRLTFSLQGLPITVSIETAETKTPEGASVQSVRFHGNIHRQIRSQAQSERVSEARSAVETWQTDRDTFLTMVRTLFLGESET